VTTNTTKRTEEKVSMPELHHNQEQRQQQRQSRSSKTSYFCSVCDFPSDTLGLVRPCAHVYCATCAAQMNTCVICNGRVHGLKTVRTGDVDDLYVSPMTLQGVFGKEAFRQHVREHLEKRTNQPTNQADNPPPTST